MQSFVSIVTDSNYEDFIKRDQTKHKVLIFTERKTTAPLFKALSKQYKEKLVMGEVRSSEKGLAEKFGVQKFPAILVITDAPEYKGDIFTEELKIDRIQKFLNKYSYT